MTGPETRAPPSGLCDGLPEAQGLARAATDLGLC